MSSGETAESERGLEDYDSRGGPDGKGFPSKRAIVSGTPTDGANAEH
jgi:hypothetical protein